MSSVAWAELVEAHAASVIQAVFRGWRFRSKKEVKAVSQAVADFVQFDIQS